MAMTSCHQYSLTLSTPKLGVDKYIIIHPIFQANHHTKSLSRVFVTFPEETGEVMTFKIVEEVLSICCNDQTFLLNCRELHGLSVP
jgi:hypothetical protein